MSVGKQAGDGQGNGESGQYAAYDTRCGQRRTAGGPAYEALGSRWLFVLLHARGR